ncbi:class I SAM-dependent DNA methyltransferase [Helicobacter pylori]|uniref:type IIG restriction enzyme/methyltransferase n=1 Tax=Helicobacter pylori TaxID=210 RepID=UPI001237CCBE|nr:Eco57I restriction-modification methylase domain-containing protein [Helicobacter pylori]KAA6507584.1 class I SAM-dependent DNA methyltransferase [Helicobacter pylori]KAA6509116.1 class I SAM-dependent DNA methyltransferase [Helicobacter pylori]KAA6515134.1 class I SAM-dependent DNA methyltransferase [Helicobacter pylori]
MDYKKLDLPNTNYPNQEQLEVFKTAFDAFLETNPQENENHQNDAFNDLLKGVFKYKVKPTKKIDSAILNDNGKVEVIIEFKALKNPNEFIKKGDLNVKALHESLFYYLIERKNGNNNLKHLILATIKELYIIDANEFEIFKKDKEIEKAFENCHDKKGNDPRTEAFYDACQKRLNELDRSLKYHHIPLKKENLALIYQALSPNFLLKIPKYSDANTLNKDFYEELLYILGLEEQNDKGKILIKPSRTENSLSAALKYSYTDLDDEEVMALLIAWNNRILFLRLLESLLISFKHFEKPFLTTENFEDFNALNTLFFEVLAKKNSERSLNKENKILEKIPYLNSSLFDQTPLESKGHEIRLLENKKLELYQNSVLKKHEEYQKQKDWTLLEYLFEFLHVYDFTTTPKDIKDNQNNSESRLINPSVLGLVFEKLNGYKEGSFYTPSFITSYMCKESIKSIVLDKFNQTYNIECEKLTELKNYFKDNYSYKENKRKEYLNTLLSLRICDPSVGSGHFLVSALNEMVLIAYKLGLIASLPLDATLKLENDEILIKISNKPFIYTCPTEQNQSHQIQKELFELKKDIIENCLFGVDINPNSCEITKLRLWIELLKYSYYIFEEGKNTNNLETLPNIDINIKCANSLISRFNLNDDLKKIPNIKKKIQEYKDLVAQYKDPNPLYPLNKQDLINKIQDLKNTFSLTLKDPKTKAELEKAIEKHIKDYNDFALDDKSLLTGLNYFIPSLFGTPKLSPKEEEEAFASYGRIRALRKKLDDALSGGEYHNAFEWRFEFPEVLDDEGDFLGFDCIIGNPPYMQVKKGLYSSIFYPFSEGKDIGKQNTYKVFIELGFNLTKQKGLISLITQSSIMCDCSAQFTRELLLKYCQIHYFVEFNKKQKLFSNVIQGVCILEFLKDRPNKEHAFKIAINNTQIQMNQIQYEQIKQDEILKFFPLYEIPLIKSGEMEIVRKIKTDKILFRDLLEKSLQGNINTIHLKAIQDQKETNGRIYKGANCHRYFLDTQYLFAKDNQITQQIFEKNYYQNIIVTQNITGTSDAYRIHANLIEVKNQEILFLDTCNLSYCKEREHAKFLVGLLNSRLLDWLFRKTSTNNHVNLYELETLPIPQITKSNKPTADKIIALVDKILQTKEKDPKANTQRLEQEIDALVYQLYNLTDEEIKTIENGQ